MDPIHVCDNSCISICHVISNYTSHYGKKEQLSSSINPTPNLASSAGTGHEGLDDVLRDRRDDPWDTGRRAHHVRERQREVELHSKSRTELECGCLAFASSHCSPSHPPNFLSFQVAPLEMRGAERARQTLHAALRPPLHLRGCSKGTIASQTDLPAIFVSDMTFISWSNQAAVSSFSNRLIWLSESLELI